MIFACDKISGYKLLIKYYDIINFECSHPKINSSLTKLITHS
jgi:hypothetical protein